MNKRQKMKIAMINSVLSFLAKNLEFLSARVPALSNAYNDLKTRTDEISSKDQEKSTVTKGKTAKKTALENKLIAMIVKLAKSLNAFAFESENYELQAKTEVTKSHLTKSRDSDILRIGNSIYDQAKAQLAGIEDYGVTNEAVELLSATIELYKTSIGEGSTGKADRVGATASLKNLFYDTDLILKKRLDNLMENFKESDSELFRKYKAVRVIRDL